MTKLTRDTLMLCISTAETSELLKFVEQMECVLVTLNSNDGKDCAALGDGVFCASCQAKKTAHTKRYNTDSPSVQPRVYPITDPRWRPDEDASDAELLRVALAEEGPRLTLREIQDKYDIKDGSEAT